MTSPVMAEPSIRFSPSRLRDARRAAGLSRDALGAATGRTAQMVGLWERGQSTPSVDALGRISAALNLPIDALFERDEATGGPS